MRRWFFGAAALVVLALGLFEFRNGILELFPGFGADREVKAAAEKAGKAAADFVVLAKDVYKTGNAPRQSDASAGPLLDAVFNVDLLKSKTALAKADLGSLADWSTSAVKVGSIFIFSGTGVADFAHPTDSPELRQQADRNTASYAPELGRYMDAELILQGAMLDVIAAMNAAAGTGSSDVKAGIDDVRSGVASTMTGVISTFAVEGITDDWRRDRLVPLNALAPKAAKLFVPEQCKALSEAAQTVSQSISDAAAQGGLRTFNDALKC